MSNPQPFQPSLPYAPNEGCNPTLRNFHDQIRETLGVERAPGWPDAFGSALRKWVMENDQQPIRTLSLFSGGGGLDIGFHDAGFQILEMVEVEKKFASTLELNCEAGGYLEGSRVNCIDIRDYKPSPHLAIDFIIGGPPCQTFSAAGRRAAGVKGTTDPRGLLFKEYVRLLRTLQPRGFLFENVYGITGAEGGKAWEKIKSDFRAAGYLITWRVLDAADYGTPQHRERVFIVGVRFDQAINFCFPRPTHGPDSYPESGFYTAGEALHDVSGPQDEKLQINGRWAHLIDAIPPGLNYSFFTKEMGHPDPVFAWRSKFSDFLYKADPASPIRTLKAQGGNYTGPFSWECRHFSSAELKRLQTFPDKYLLSGGRQIQAHQLGNSVPPQIARILGMAVRKFVFGRRIPIEFNYLGESDTLGFRTRKRDLTNHYAELAKRAHAKRISKSTQNSKKTGLIGTNQFWLTSRFSLEFIQNAAAIPFQSTISLDSRGRLSLAVAQHAKRNNEENHELSILIRPTQSKTWSISEKEICIHVSGPSLMTLTAGWKILEEHLRQKYGVDDLVQLRGYYQYPGTFTCSIILKSCESSICRAVSAVTRGIGTGKLAKSKEIADMWGLTGPQFRKAAGELRQLGFEIRNQNTNPQIAKGEILIPYQFPTLTPRSVQTYKSLF